MPSVTTSELDLGFGYSASIRTEASGEGNSLRTRVTTIVSGPATQKMRVEWSDRSIRIDTEGVWEGAAMATLLRGLANSLDGL